MDLIPQRGRLFVLLPFYGVLEPRLYKPYPLLRRKRREKRLKEWGYSSTEFDLLMEEHLRSKNRFKKRSLADRIRSWFRRR